MILSPRIRVDFFAKSELHLKKTYTKTLHLPGVVVSRICCHLSVILSQCLSAARIKTICFLLSNVLVGFSKAFINSSRVHQRSFVSPYRFLLFIVKVTISFLHVDFMYLNVIFCLTTKYHNKAGRRCLLSLA